MNAENKQQKDIDAQNVKINQFQITRLNVKKNHKIDKADFIKAKLSSSLIESVTHRLGDRRTLSLNLKI